MYMHSLLPILALGAIGHSMMAQGRGATHNRHNRNNWGQKSKAARIQRRKNRIKNRTARASRVKNG